MTELVAMTNATPVSSPRSTPGLLRHLSVAFTLAATLITSTTAGTASAQTTSAEATEPTDTSAASTPATPAVTGPDPVVKCVESYTEGQRLRNDGHLLEGRTEFWECSQAACPAALRKDCITWSEEIRAQIPTVSFRVTLDGKIASDAKVYLDGRLLDKALDGRAVELNPGPHKAGFELGQFPAQEQDFVAAEGERYRIINAEFKSAATAGTGSGVAGGTSDSGVTTAERPVPVVTYVLLGVGAAGAISAAVWGISASVTKSDLEATCAPECSQNKIDAVKQRALISDVSTGVSILGFAGAAITYFTRPETPSAGSVEFGATNLGDHGAFGMLKIHTN